MHKFKVGDYVIAMNSKACKVNPREEGKEYKILGLMKCPQCSDDYICVTRNDTKVRSYTCGDCGFDGIRSNHPWTSAKHFRLKGNTLEAQLKDALLIEDYELAARLRDQMNS